MPRLSRGFNKRNPIKQLFPRRMLLLFAYLPHGGSSIGRIARSGSIFSSEGRTQRVFAALQSFSLSPAKTHSLLPLVPRELRHTAMSSGDAQTQTPVQNAEATNAKAAVVHGHVDLCKPEEQYRNYKDSARHELVSNHYRLMRTNQVWFCVRLSGFLLRLQRLTCDCFARCLLCASICSRSAATDTRLCQAHAR